jgi:hypothetical protein
MINSNSFSVASKRLLIAGLVASSIFAMALPSFAHAATYAYVNQSGEVSTVTANDWQSAIANAFKIHINSGVMLLVSQLDFGLVGDSI